MVSGMTRVFVWSIYTRAFHALLALFVITSFLSSEFDILLTLHVASGSAVGVLLTFRIFWGLMNIKYSKFSDFNFNIGELKEYLFNVFGEKKSYIGHNPPASFVMIAMIVVGILAVVSGVLVYGIQEGRGLLSFLNSSMFRDMEAFEEIHEFLSNLFIFLIFIHVAGVLVDKFIHKSDTLNSILNGYKSLKGENVKLNLFHKLFGVIWIVVAISTFIYTFTPKNIITSNINKEVLYAKELPSFVDECASCHILYPPHLLPKKSWEKMMANLEEHFGDDASLDEETRVAIEEYLIKNSAESSTKEASIYGLKSMSDKEIIAISETPYWKKRHKKIPEKVFENESVKSKANCKACHSGIEKGLIEDENIKIANFSIIETLKTLW